MADKGGIGSIGRFPRMSSPIPMKPEHEMENRTLSRTSNYNETVRANNRRYDKDQPGKRLPKGRTAAAKWRKSGR